MTNSIQINIISTNTFTINSYDKITNKKRIKKNKQTKKQRNKERKKQINEQYYETV